MLRVAAQICTEAEKSKTHSVQLSKLDTSEITGHRWHGVVLHDDHDIMIALANVGKTRALLEGAIEGECPTLSIYRIYRLATCHLLTSDLCN